MRVWCDISTRLRPSAFLCRNPIKHTLWHQAHGEHGVGIWVEFIPCRFFNWRWMDLLFPADCFSKEFTCLRVALKEKKVQALSFAKNWTIKSPAAAWLARNAGWPCGPAEFQTSSAPWCGVSPTSDSVPATLNQFLLSWECLWSREPKS